MSAREIIDPGSLRWRPYRVWRPVYFTHDRNGFLLPIDQIGSRYSKWFERVLRTDDCSWPFGPAYRSLSPTERE